MDMCVCVCNNDTCNNGSNDLYLYTKFKINFILIYDLYYSFYTLKRQKEDVC